MRTSIVFSVCLLFLLNLSAQTLEISPLGGVLIPHRMSMRGLVERPSSGLQISYAPKANLNNLKNNDFNKPKLVVSGLIQDFGNQEVLGRAYAFSVSMRFFKKLGNHWTWTNSLSTGLGYFTEKFDPEDNNKNIAIGSRLNSFESLSTTLLYGRNRCHLGAGISAVHFSNGRMKTPNLGLNLLQMHVRFAYVFESNATEPITLLPVKEISGLSFGASFGVNQRTKPGGPSYGAFNFRSVYQRSVWRSSYWGIAMDAMYSGHNEAILRDENRPNKFMDVLQFGIAGCFTYQLDDVFLEFGPGIYVYDQAKLNSFHYFKFRLYWMMNEKFGVSFGLKTHGATADYNEFGLTYAL